MKTLFKFVFYLMCVLLLSGVLAPFALSQEWGRKYLLKSYNYFSKNSLNIDDLSLSWTQGQQIKGIKWIDQKSGIIFSCDTIETDASLSKIVFGHNIGNTTISSPQIMISSQSDKKNNFRSLEPVGFVSDSPPLADSLNTPSLAYHPLFKPNFNWIKYQGALTLKKGNIFFLSQKFPPLKFENLDVELSRTSKEDLHIQALCQITEKDVTGTLEITGNMTDIATNTQALSIESKLLHFPLRSLDQAAALFNPEWEGLFTELMGPSLSAHLKLASSKDLLSLDIDINSAQFSAYAKTEAKEGVMSLYSPALFNWTFSPSALKALTGLESEQDVTAVIKINRLKMPLSNQTAFDFQAEFRLSEILTPSFKTEPLVFTLSSENFQEKLFKASLSSPQLSCSEILFSCLDGFKLLEEATLFGDVKGKISQLTIPSDLKNLAIQANLAVKIPDVEDPLQVELNCSSIKEISLICKNKNFDSIILGELNPQEMTFKTSHTTEVTYHLEDSNLYLHINPCLIPLEASKIKKLTLTGGGKADNILFQGHTFKDVVFSFAGEGEKQKLELDASLSVNGAPFKCLLEARHWMPKTQLHIQAQGTNIPTTLISPYFPKALPILGETMTFDCDLNSSDTSQTISVKADTKNLHCDLSFNQEDNSLRLSKPSEISVNLSDEVYKALVKTPLPFEITDANKIDCKITELSLPVTLDHYRLPSFESNLKKTQIQGDFLIDKLSLKDEQNITTLDHVKIHLSQPSFKSPLTFQLSSSAGPQGILSIQGSIDHRTSALSINGIVQQFPTKALEFLTAAKFPLSTLFGETLNLNVISKIQENKGPLKVTLHSPHTRISLDAFLNKGVLTLNDTVYAQLTLTQDLSRVLLTEVSPLSSTIIEATSPLTLEIPKEDVAISLMPFSLKTTYIPHAKIELGKILCENKGNLSDLLGILKLTTSSDKPLSTWFSPLVLSLKDGTINSERTDILVADNYQICSWGAINFLKDDVDLTLGLTSSCLKKAFKIQDLPDNYVLQIPMTGPINNVQVNTALATTKIAALLLWQQKAALGDKIGGSPGKLLGGLLNSLGPLPGQENTAPPAQHPLPWENTKKDLTSADKEKENDVRIKKKHFKPHEKPLKQILKMVR